MSKIGTVRPNFQNLNKNQNTMNSNPSFKGGKAQVVESALTKAEEFVVDRALTSGYLGNKGHWLDKFSLSAGEIQNLWIMNLGTAFVAPIFIVNNPLSKEDINTRKYSAWRQPISAVNAMAIGWAINTPAVILSGKLAAIGSVKRFDMSAKPPTDFLKLRFNGIKKHFDKMGKLDKEYFDKINADGNIKTRANFDEKYGNYKAFESAIHEVTLGKAAEKLLDKTNEKGLYKQTVKDFLIKNLNFESDYIDKSILNKYAVEPKLESTLAMDFLEKFGFDDKKVNEKSLRTFMGDNFYREKFVAQSNIDKNLASQMFDVFQELANKNQITLNNKKEIGEMFSKNLSKHGFESMERKTIARLSEMLISEELKNTKTISLKNLFKVLNLDEAFHENKEVLDMPMNKFLLWLDEKLDIESAVESAKPVKKQKLQIATDIVAKEANDLKKLGNFAKNIAKNAAAKAAGDFGAYKNIQGIALTLALLPLTCGILNWIYPRIMEKCFPKLCASKAAAQGGK